MTETATVQDYREHLTHLLVDQREALRTQIDQAIAQATLTGGPRSGPTLKKVADVTKTRLREAMDGAFEQERHAILTIPFLEEDDIEAQSEQALANFTDEISALAQDYFNRLQAGPAATRELMARMALSEDLARRTKAQRKGFAGSALSPKLVSPTINNNSLHVQTAIGSAFQQGSHGSSISMENHINLQTVASAVNSLERELAKLDANAPQVLELSADLAGVKGQLKKANPALTVLKELGSSIRSVIEGAAGGAIGNALTPSAIAAAGALVGALGG